MINNNLNVFRITGFLVNTAGEESCLKTVEFNNSESDAALKKSVLDFIQSEMCLNYLDRMNIELEEIQEKINKAEEFLLKEDREPKFLDEKQKELLELQVSHMKHYYSVLKQRIEYDSNK